MAWPFKRYGTASDPIHKSHLNAITGDYGCPTQFRYSMDERHALGLDYSDERDSVAGKAAAGTAAHETIARAASSPEMLAHLLRGGAPDRARVASVFAEELDRERGGRELLWFDKDPSEIIAERVTMIVGVLATLHRYVAEVLLIEPGFIAEVDGFWLSGHMDLVFRPRSAPDRIAIADWKTGEHKPHPIELDHGWEGAVYATAIKRGVLFPREQLALTAEPDGRSTVRCGRHSVTHASRYIAERTALERTMIDYARGERAAVDTVAYDDYPAEIWHVHAHDFIPYRKAGTKAVKRKEDIEWHGYESAQRSHKYSAGEQRGPGWLPVQLTEYDIPRLGHRLRNVVGSIRMGRFIDQVGERCARCPFAKQCLTTGYAPRGDEARGLDRALRVVDSAEADAAFDIDD